MDENSTKTEVDGTSLFAGEVWFDPAANASRFGEIEAGIRERVRGFIQEMLEQELTAALGRARHERAEGDPAGYRNGTRERQLLGSFGAVTLSVPRARMAAEGGGTQEWRSASLPRYARMTKQVEALIATWPAPTRAGSSAPWPPCSEAPWARTSRKSLCDFAG